MTTIITKREQDFFKGLKITLDGRYPHGKCLDAVLQGTNTEIELSHHCKRFGDYTRVILSHDSKHLISFNFPNSLCWKDAEGDWDWDFVGRAVFDYLIVTNMGKKKAYKGEFKEYIA